MCPATWAEGRGGPPYHFPGSLQWTAGEGKGSKAEQWNNFQKHTKKIITTTSVFCGNAVKTPHKASSWF